MRTPSFLKKSIENASGMNGTNIMELISMNGIRPNSPPPPHPLYLRAADLALPLPPQFYDISINHPVIELSESEILKDENLPIGNIVSEGASRPLISEKSPGVREEAIKQKVKY